MARSPRKIIHLTTVDLSLRYLLQAQIDASLATGDEVVGVSARGPDVPHLEARGMRFIELPGSTRAMNPLADLRAAHSLWRILRTERPAVLHTHTPKPGWYGRVIGRLAGVPRVVHTTHGLYAQPEDPLAKRIAVYLLEAVASRFSHVELVQNPEDFELMMRLKIAPRKKLRLLGNGVDLHRFRPPTSEERDRVRMELGIAEGEIIVGVVARLVKEKGIPELFEAALRLGRPFRLLVVGPHEQDKSDAIDDEHLEVARRNGAIILGHRSDVDRLYWAMDIYCLPSHREGLPRSAIEAAACGLPVVATNIRGCRQVVDQGRTGYLVPVGNAEAIAAALCKYTDVKLRRTHGRAAREKAQSSFDEDDVVRRVLVSYGSHE